MISSLLLLSYRLWKVRCNIVHAQSPGDFYGDEEETTHSLIREILSTDPLSLPGDKRYILNFTFEEIITNRGDWIKAWIITALEYIDTATSRDQARVIAQQRPTARARKRADLSRAFCQSRDERRLIRLQCKFQHQNLDNPPCY